MIQKGYEIKDFEISPDSHKYIAFRALCQQRWIRGRTSSLGTEYTRERIKERIEEKSRIRTGRMQKSSAGSRAMIDTTQERFAESPGLKRWADLQNLKTAAKLQSKLAEMGLSSLEEVNDKIEALHLQAKTGKKTTIMLDKQKKSAAEILRYAKQYAEKAKYAKNYEKSKNPERYYQAHSYDIHLAWSSAEILENAGIDPETMNLHQIEKQYEKLCLDRQATSVAYKKAEADCEKLKRLRYQLLSFVDQDYIAELERDDKAHTRE